MADDGRQPKAKEGISVHCGSDSAILEGLTKLLLASIARKASGLTRSMTMAQDESDVVVCKECRRPLPEHQVRMLNKPEYNLWYREGYCSLSCFQKQTSAVSTSGSHLPSQIQPAIAAKPTDQLLAIWRENDR